MISISDDFKAWTAIKQALQSEPFSLLLAEMEKASEVNAEWCAIRAQTLRKVDETIERLAVLQGDPGTIRLDGNELQLIIAALEIQMARLRVCLIWSPETKDGYSVNDGGFLESIREKLADAVATSSRRRTDPG